MEKTEKRLNLSTGTWIGICGLVLALLGLYHREMAHLRQDVSSSMGALTKKIDDFQGEMRDIHGRLSKAEKTLEFHGAGQQIAWTEIE